MESIDVYLVSETSKPLTFSMRMYAGGFGRLTKQKDFRTYQMSTLEQISYFSSNAQYSLRIEIFFLFRRKTYPYSFTF